MRLLISIITSLFVVSSCGTDVEHSHVSQVEKNKLVVISDIDDTIRLSGGKNKFAKVRSFFKRKDMTFWGLNELYRSIGRTTHSETQFYYVTAAPKTRPISIFEIVSESVTDANFPEGVMIGKPNIRTDTYEYKLKNHIEILESHPEADILLLGDDTSQDHRVYKELKRRYTSRNITYFVHLVAGSVKNNLQNFFATVGDLSLSLYDRKFLSQEDVLTINSEWQQGLVWKKIRSKKIFPSWLNCKGFYEFFKKNFPGKKNLSKFEGEMEVIEKELQVSCSSDEG